MNNNYDVTLTSEEKEQLVKNLVAITDYLKDLVKDLDTSTTISAEWAFYDNVFGDKKCSLSIERRISHNGHQKDTKITGKIGGLYIDLSNEITLEAIRSCQQDFALSLLDYWAVIKSDLMFQVERRQKTRNLIKDFEL